MSESEYSLKITFTIHYLTTWGQRVVVTGPRKELGDGDLSGAFRLKHSGEGYWKGILELADSVDSFRYKYAVVDDEFNLLDEDWGALRELRQLKGKRMPVLLKDTWRGRLHPGNFLYTSAFSKVIFKPRNFRVKAPSRTGDVPITFRIKAPRVEPDHQICILGNIPELGNWDLSRAVLLGNTNHPLWAVTTGIKPQRTIEYKYGLFHQVENRVVNLETGANRTIHYENLPYTGVRLIVTDEYFRHGKSPWKGAGIAVPVFSLRSETGFGVGEFNDIKLLVDWAKKPGLQLIQILPINDTTVDHTWTDSYPYSAISIFALHPLYLNLEQVEGFKQCVDQKQFDRERKKLNALVKVDYDSVIQGKLRYARKIFIAGKEALADDPDFREFVRKNQSWLKPYALFCYLRDYYRTADFNQWNTHRIYSGAMLHKMTSPGSPPFEEISFHYFLQYHLHRQLSDATRYARENGIVFKGDLPIGIYRHSVEAWVDPTLFNMDRQAGAPPDPFSDTGQNWGFPTYRWEEMARDGYAWWKDRLKQLAHYFDAFRIDHILGFFRIWEIPIDQIEGTMGYFNPALPIAREELDERGIEFQYDRFCKPYINDHILDELFREDAPDVKSTFLVKRDGLYDFKEHLDTQTGIEQFFTLPENTTLSLPWKEKLFQLISNVLLFEVPGSNEQEFHARIDLKKTSSFKELDEGTQQKMEALYIDYFYVRQDEFWKEQAMAKLPGLIGATDMLICGEDLGMVPHCVPEVMRDLGLLSLEIQRMSKNPLTEFLQPRDIPYLSVCSPSTHDMAPIRAWWEESNREQIQRFYTRELKLEGNAPQTCDPQIVEDIIEQHLRWPSMWAVFMIQDILGMSPDLRAADPFEERINVPSNPRNYWQYRMHLTLERLLEEKEFNRKVRDLIEESGRIER